MGRFSACGGGTIEITCPDKDVAHAIYKAIEDLIYTAKERMMNSNQNQVRSQRERRQQFWREIQTHYLSP